jgi:hypothetical protein
MCAQSNAQYSDNTEHDNLWVQSEAQMQLNTDNIIARINDDDTDVERHRILGS